MDLKNRASILLLMACICNSVIASDTTEEEPTNAASPLVEEQASIAETPAQTEETTASEETKLDISGFIDGAYSYMLRSDLFPNEERIIANDASTNSFAIHQLAVKFAYQPKEGLGAVFLPIFGQDAFDYSPKGLDPNIGIHNFGFAPINAFAQYAQGSFTAYAGILTALTGYESMEPTEDINFSRSALFTVAVPDTVTGLRGTYVVNKKLSLTAGVNNGWATVEDTSRPKTIELNGAYKPNSIFDLTMTVMSGGQRAELEGTTGPIGRRNMLDLYSDITITEKLGLAFNYDYGIQNKAELPNDTIAKAHWQGVAGYINYKFTDKWKTSFRAEIFDDYEGYLTGIAQVWKEVTLTVAYSLSKDIEIRAEARHDFSSADAYKYKGSDNHANNQQLFAIEAYYKF